MGASSPVGSWIHDEELAPMGRSYKSTGSQAVRWAGGRLRFHSSGAADMPKSVPAPCRHQESADPRLLRGARNAAVTGLMLVMLLPAARGHSDWLGWMPLWLVGMPLVAWWSLHRFALPLRKSLARDSSKPARRRRPGAQARRRVVPGSRRLPRAA